jgi:hypothetical protein
LWKAAPKRTGKKSDAELDRTGYVALAGVEMTAQQFLEAVILTSGGEHFANMKAAVEV